MIRQKARDRQYRLFGIMAVTLGCGDAFHLVPRAYALCTTGLEKIIQQLLASVNLLPLLQWQCFYILLYYVWRNRYKIEGKRNYNSCISDGSSSYYSSACFRRMPDKSRRCAAVLGIYETFRLPFWDWSWSFCFAKCERAQGQRFRWMWLTIVLSFGFYSVVLGQSHRTGSWNADDS